MSQETKLIESVPLREAGWYSWIDGPPQIGSAFIELWRESWETPSLIRRDGMSPFANVYGLFWRPTGIYREEYYSVTGQWI